MLLCPVRNCQLPIQRDDRRLVCARGHSFDVARSGYINLLQPQERRSKQPGDAAAAVAARRRLHDLGVTEPLRKAVSAMVAAGPGDTVLDAGCGEGFYLANLAAETGCAGHGVDISIPAIDAAAKRYPHCEWIVANADRAVPYAVGSFSVVMSITARMNAPEFLRVLRPGGRLIVAIPAPEDLIELRGESRERADRTVESFAAGFTLEDRKKIVTAAALDTAAVEDVLLSIYRPSSEKRPAEAKRVTFGLELLLFRAVTSSAG